MISQSFTSPTAGHNNSAIARQNQSPPLGRMVAPWTCSHCWSSNGQINQLCHCCGLDRDRMVSGGSPLSSCSPNSAVPSAFQQPQSPGHWKCSPCQEINQDTASKCLMCGHARIRFQQASASVPSMLQAQVSSHWQCPSCRIMVDGANPFCGACGCQRGQPRRVPMSPSDLGPRQRCSSPSRRGQQQQQYPPYGWCHREHFIGSCDVERFPLCPFLHKYRPNRSGGANPNPGQVTPPVIQQSPSPQVPTPMPPSPLSAAQPAQMFGYQGVGAMPTALQGAGTPQQPRVTPPASVSTASPHSCPSCLAAAHRAVSTTEDDKSKVVQALASLGIEILNAENLVADNLKAADKLFDTLCSTMDKHDKVEGSLVSIRERVEAQQAAVWDRIEDLRANNDTSVVAPVTVSAESRYRLGLDTILELFNTDSVFDEATVDALELVRKLVVQQLSGKPGDSETVSSMNDCDKKSAPVTVAVPNDGATSSSSFPSDSQLIQAVRPAGDEPASHPDAVLSDLVKSQWSALPSGPVATIRTCEVIDISPQEAGEASAKRVRIDESSSMSVLQDPSSTGLAASQVNHRPVLVKEVAFAELPVIEKGISLLPKARRSMARLLHSSQSYEKLRRLLARHSKSRSHIERHEVLVSDVALCDA